MSALKKKSQRNFSKEQSSAGQGEGSQRKTPHLRIVIAILLLIVATLAVYWRVGGFDFIRVYDDARYVFDNPNIKDGLTWKGLGWAFTSAYEVNWHPFTWISHMIDIQAFGLNPAAHHWVNVLFHLLNGVLLFLLLRRLTGTFGRSLVVAVFFLVHPLHVESVAWIAERKDVLSCFWGLLTLLAYDFYLRRPGLGRYLLIVSAFAIGLMAKPMLVTIPLVMLLLDYWPLKRLPIRSSVAVAPLAKEADVAAVDPNSRRAIFKLILEKLPLLVLSLGSAFVTVAVQHAGGAVQNFGRLPVLLRLENAVISFFAYLWKTAWPFVLGVFYPYPEGGYSIALVAGAAVGLLLMAALTFKWRRSYPFVLTGWWWYVITLLPVIGIIQVGAQSMADRYSYIPLIGVFIALVWGIAEVARRYHWPGKALAVAAALVSIGWAGLAFRQTLYWQDSETLFRRTLAITANNYVAESNLGVALNSQGKTAEGIKHLASAVRIRPEFPDLRLNLGKALFASHRREEGIEQVRQAIARQPDNLNARLVLGRMYVRAHQPNEALAELNQVLKLDPDNPEATLYSGLAKAQLGEMTEAETLLRRSIELDPAGAEPLVNYGYFLLRESRFAKASECFTRAVQIDPKNAEAYVNLGYIYFTQRRYDEAAGQFRKALQINPAHPTAAENLRKIEPFLSGH